MLVLSRKEKERIIIDGNIVITIVRIAGGSVRLGIEAPAEHSIQREEVLNRLMNADARELVAVK